MKNSPGIFILAIVSNVCLVSCKAQQSFGENYLKLKRVVSLPGVSGRIDHMDVNLKAQIVYMAALGNNSLEVIDIRNGRLIHSLKGLDEPQGVAYIPQTNEVIVANGGNGDCYFYNASTYEKVNILHLTSEADDIRYDSLHQKIYVGYGEGGIAEIDAVTHKQSADIKLPAHPEGFQIDLSQNLLLANVPDKKMIVAIDLIQHKVVSTWVKDRPTANFPMAMDTISHQAFIGYRHPASLRMIQIKTGTEVGNTKIVGDTDDLYFEQVTQRLYVSGGEGYVNLFEAKKDGRLNQIANIPTRNGARTSLLIPQLSVYVLALRAGSGQPAQLNIYETSE